jgi:hypothetical protein
MPGTSKCAARYRPGGILIDRTSTALMMLAPGVKRLAEFLDPKHITTGRAFPALVTDYVQRCPFSHIQ